ncbi:MAG: DNA recombination protein RmuC [Gemmatimonadaceae bacterium]
MMEDLVSVAIVSFLVGALAMALATWIWRARWRAERDAAVARADAQVLDRQQLRDSFQSLGVDALRQNGELFMQMARTELERTVAQAQSSLVERERAIEFMVEPIQDGLARYDAKIGELERERAQHFGQLTQRMDDVVASNTQLRGETHHLAQALRAPAVRGVWGEMQLRRVCELAGMLEHCDFVTQLTVEDEDRRQRPDLVVRLAGDRSIVVDAKAPLGAYLESVGEPDEARRAALMRDHARQVRAHVTALGRKEYWQQFERSPEFVVLFLPGEAFFSAALQADPSLMEAGLADGVVLATPTTFIALLKSVAYGWRHDALARNASEISALGRELYERMALLASHLAAVGDGLKRATDSYNSAVGSLERRVFPTARRFKEMGAAPPQVDLPVLDFVSPPTQRVVEREL